VVVADFDNPVSAVGSAKPKAVDEDLRTSIVPTTFGLNLCKDEAFLLCE
jgi:hypothetical protein